ncbi:hypothetical protein [Nannocystis punicea]|uniref:EF-hand domain-containing protein n=1 Tax=Nannocystis punicea TaxID=2995304 RepID=A0ABY7GS30_9BACT|nr:hypothetical protein [Nannocystis poenicansa]WAS89755.1 hypothetical protein O0S08_26480 [Nannocystis poenicansa]
MVAGLVFGPWNPSMLRLHVSLSLSLSLLSACAAGEEPVERDIAVSLADASFVEDGIHPSTVKDGWVITFSELQVSIGDVMLEGSSLDDTSQQYRIVDLVRAGEGLVLGSAQRTSEHPHALVRGIGFTIAPSADPVAGNVDESDVERMRTGSYSVHVKGTARRGEETKDFSWGLTAGNVYKGCISQASFADEAPQVTISVRGDRLFGDEELVFEPFAASDANADGEIEEAELRDSDGTLGGKNLWTWLEAQAGTLFSVEGSPCTVEPS